MVKQVLEGLSVLPSPPKSDRQLIEPVVYLNDGLILDDSVFEAPTIITGCVGSGKTVLLEKIMEPILAHAEKKGENVFIFCAKKDMLKYRRPQDPVIAVDTVDPKGCWNIFKEMRASKNADLAARDIAKSLTSDQKSQLQPFFENSANDLLYSSVMAMYDEEKKTGEQYTNWHLCDFLNRVSLRRDAELSWYDLAELRPERFAHIFDYLGNESDQAYGIISELRTLLHNCFWGSFCSDQGEFSAIEALKTGGKRIILYYDYANASEASVKMFSTILNLLFKHSVDPDNEKRTWFFIDEASQLPRSCVVDAMSLGRQYGFRLFICLQSAQLMTRHYCEAEANAQLCLFPNVICLKTMDSFTRRIFADRYGDCLCAYNFHTPMQKVVQHVVHRPVVADYDFSMIQKKGDALCSIPALNPAPFFYHGYREDLKNG